MKKLTSMLGLLLLLPSGALLAEPATTPSLIDQAEAARKEAAALKYEWRDTGTIITAAKDALAKGQKEESDRLASIALQQGRSAVAQAKYMEKNWKRMIPKQ